MFFKLVVGMHILPNSNSNHRLEGGSSCKFGNLLSLILLLWLHSLRFILIVYSTPFSFSVGSYISPINYHCEVRLFTTVGYQATIVIVLESSFGAAPRAVRTSLSSEYWLIRSCFLYYMKKTKWNADSNIYRELDSSFIYMGTGVEHSILYTGNSNKWNWIGETW